MAHLLRKYLSNRGSALFMVISTMTALIISCMAMYFTMVSARASQYAVFSQMQTTQTAVSLKDVILNSFSPDNVATGGNALFNKILDLDEGDCITTDANGFMALDPNVETGKTPAEIGAYSVTITCLEKNATTGDMKFDILAMASFNGSRDAVHFTFDYKPNNPDAPLAEDGAGGDAELFAATGYIPHDAYINGGYYLTNVFYDTQYTYMGTFNNAGNNRIALNLNTGGDLMMSTNAMTLVHEPNCEAIKSEDANKVGPVTWAIRGNFYSNFGNDFDERGGSQIFVGGDFICAGNNAFFMKKDDGYTGTVKLGDHISVYINGDFQYCSSDLKDNIWYFVNGKVTNTMNGLPSHSRLFVTGATDAERKAKVENGSLKNSVEEWPLDKWPDGMWDGKDKINVPLTYNQAMQELGKRTRTIDYYKWDLSENTKESDANQHINIRMNATDSPWNDTTTNKTYDAMAGTYVIAYPGSDSAKLVNDKKENGVVGKAFIIDSVIARDGSSNAAPAVLIDTGDDPNNIITLKLSDVTGQEEFSWFVKPDKNIPTDQPDGSQKTMRLVLTKGRGTVLIDIPKNLTYRNASHSFTGHLGWWLAMGGTVNKTSNDHITFLGVKTDSKLSPEIVKYVHKTCGEGDGCVFTTKDSTIDCAGCSGKLTQVSCSIHGDVNKFCGTCYPDKKDKKDWCVNHVDKVAYDAKYNSITDSLTKAWGKDSKGTVYPNTNFMLVSCDESIDINFARDRNNTYLDYATFCGFVYAPYLSFMADGQDNGGGKIRLCGGMTVGDYTLNGFESYIGCYPDKMPNELAGMEGGGNMAGGKLEGAVRSWKITVGGYT